MASIVATSSLTYLLSRDFFLFLIKRFSEKKVSSLLSLNAEIVPSHWWLLLLPSLIRYQVTYLSHNGLKLFLKKHSYFQPETMNSPTDVISTPCFGRLEGQRPINKSLFGQFSPGPIIVSHRLLYSAHLAYSKSFHHWQAAQSTLWNFIKHGVIKSSS